MILEELVFANSHIEEKNQGKESLSQLTDEMKENGETAKQVHDLIMKTSESAEKIFSAREMIRAISD